MDLVDLETFASVARHGGITRAASTLNTVQSNVTARLKALETELGTRLFERHSRGVILIMAGQRLLPYAGRIQALVAEARRATTDDGIPRGALRLGAMETTAALRLPLLLATYAHTCPEVDLVVSTGATAALIQEVLEHRLDAALVAAPVAHPELEEEAAFEEELVLITAPDLRDPDALTRTAGLKVLVFRAGCSYRQRLEAVLTARGIFNARWMEFGTLDGIVGCVAAGVGVTLLPRAVVKQAWMEGRIALHALPATEANVTTVLIRRCGVSVSSALDVFLRTVRSDQSLAEQRNSQHAVSVPEGAPTEIERQASAEYSRCLHHPMIAADG